MEKELPKKVTFFSKIQHKWNVFIEKLSNSQDFKSAYTFIFDIVLSGVLLNLGGLLLGLPFGITPILALGCGYWFVSNKIVPQILIPLLSAFRLSTK